MTDEDRKAWEIWVDYCRKLDKWYKANPAKAEEYEPILMTPPFGAIVESVLAADVELTALRAQLARVEDVEGMAKVIKDSWLGNSGILAPTSIARAVSAWLKEGKG